MRFLPRLGNLDKRFQRNTKRARKAVKLARRHAFEGLFLHPIALGAVLLISPLPVPAYLLPTVGVVGGVAVLFFCVARVLREVRRVLGEVRRGLREARKILTELKGFLQAVEDFMKAAQKFWQNF